MTLAFLTVAPQALAASGDVAATHAYIQANYALAQASVARLAAGQTKIERLNGSLAQACPDIGAGSPEDEASQPISHEVAVALWSIGYGADAGPINTFAATVRRLHWSSHTITRAAVRYADSLQAIATIRIPDLCGDVSAWKASGFQIIPAAALSLVQRVEAIELTAISPRLLAPYERGADASTLARTMRLETMVEEHEFTVGQHDWNQVLETLGLNE